MTCRLDAQTAYRHQTSPLPLPIAGTATMCAFWQGSPDTCLLKYGCPAGQPLPCADEQGYLDAAAQGEKLYKRIEFNTAGNERPEHFGGEYDKLRHLTELSGMCWSSTYYSRGRDTYKTDLAFDRIRRRFTLHLSGHTLLPHWRTMFGWGCHLQLDLRHYGVARCWNWQAHRGSRTPTANPPMLNLYTYRCPRSSGTRSAGRGDRRRNAGICL